MLPQPLIEKYWRDVEDELVAGYGHSRPVAASGVREYRGLLARRGVGDMAYHAGPKDAAAAIDTGIKEGFAEPPVEPAGARADQRFTVAGNDGDDAKPYLEREVERTIREVEESP